ncbi:hypothetical protein J437_LFUL008670 [Ladona fulva]|uniref:C3H1-type domain-containing protein n=1 Tax=Ladona fulva TaxID=123851 RepID=A0A8K0P0N1_LADFU|nr:hypothetical protein J437_LFUL008670 [Ladona fulva]
MADSKEKNLLNEIAYLTRLIGQHKHQLATSNAWDANGYKFSSSYPGANVHSRLTKSVKPIQTSSFRHASAAKQKPSMNIKLNSRENIQQKTNVHLNPKFQAATPRVAEVLNLNPSKLEVPRVHINPNFYRAEKISKSPQINVNSKAGDVTEFDSKTVKSSDIVSKSNALPEQKLKVHVNPKFCKVLPANSPHTQLRTLMANKVHVNPKLVERVLKEKNESGVAAANCTKVEAQVSALGYNPSVFPKPNSVNFAASYNQNIEKAKLISQASSKRNEFITLGNRKLVRINRRQDSDSKKDKHRIRRNSISSSRQKRISIVSPRTVKKAKSITSKYKLVKIHSPVPSPSSKANVRTKYKIDRTANANFYLRTPKKDNLALRLKKSKLPQRQGRFPVGSSRTSNGNLVWQRTWSLLAEEFKTTNTKLYRIGSSPVVKKDTVNSAKVNNVFSTSLVRIGGVLYKSSRNKLTRSQCPVNTPKKKTNSAVPLRKKGKLNTKQQFLLIRGHKFVMDAQGKTLRRVTPANSSFGKEPSAGPSYSLRRVDIGGVTFVQKSSNVLMRTDTHKARSLLSYAKQKSIATLMKKLKKNNQPCMFYRRFGRCLRNEKGKCPCVHDRKHVDCKKRHINICPDFEKKGECLKGKNCPYPHIKAKRNQPKKRMSIKVSKPTSSYKHVVDLKKKPMPVAKVEMKRYYLTPGEPVGISSNISDNSGNQTSEECKSNVNIPCSTQVSRVSDQKTTAEERMADIIPSRIIIEREKIGTLPSFIPL